PGRYPETPQSDLFINDGKGKFSIDSGQSTEFTEAGMISDAVWVDLNADGLQDLITIGEWMPVKIFINEKGKLVDHSGQFLTEPSEGWWNCLLAHDFDNDGDPDFVIGNNGLNHQMNVSRDQPASLTYFDFDSNNSVDPLLTYFVQGVTYPYATRDELTEQLPSFKKRFTDYKSYSTAKLDKGVLTSEEIRVAKKLSAYRMETSYLRNDRGKLTFVKMPTEIQFAPVFAMTSMDVNRDGHDDLVTGGNLTATRARTGSLTGNNGFIFLGDGKGNFRFLPAAQSGLRLSGDVRKMTSRGSGLIVGCNNDSLRVFQLR
ncbi:MAG: VCBS repeat-containing protein, partial [Bacteroidota bacterium]|nr:VCBS repeat-containing protein [Bacteroidota bacterium]